MIDKERDRVDRRSIEVLLFGTSGRDFNRNSTEAATAVIMAVNGHATTITGDGERRRQGEINEQEQKNGLGRLAFCTVGICLCYCYYGLLQESLFSGSNFGALFVLVTQCFTNFVVAILWQILDQKKKKLSSFSIQTEKAKEHVHTTTDGRSLHHSLIMWTSACYVAAMACSNESFRYVSYPVAVLAKSCKLVPTMLVGQVVEGKLYSFSEWLVALSISTGIVLFHFSRMKQQKDEDNLQKHEEEYRHYTYGVILLLISLVCDGLLASCQQFLKRTSKQKYRPPNAIETMLYVNIYSMLFLLPLSILSGQWQEGLGLLFNGDDDVNWVHNLILLNTAVAVGQIFIFLTITWYTPIITTTITTTRKFFTILLSVYAFDHTFSVLQWTGTALVFFGLYMVILIESKKSSIVEENREQQPKAKTE